MSNLIINALMAKAVADEQTAIANLSNYLNNSVGVGEHPDVVSECEKQVKKLSEARDTIETLKQMIEQNSEETTEES